MSLRLVAVCAATLACSSGYTVPVGSLRRQRVCRRSSDNDWGGDGSGGDGADGGAWQSGDGGWTPEGDDDIVDKLFDSLSPEDQYMAREAKRASMRAAGLSEEQIECYLAPEGADDCEVPLDDALAAAASAEVPGAASAVRKDSDADALVAQLQSASFGSVVEPDAAYGTRSSHELVETDDEGEPLQERFVYVAALVLLLLLL